MVTLICLSFDYKFCNDDYFCHCKLCSKQRYNQDFVRWKQQWNTAKAAGDYDALDALDAKFEMIGMP